MRIDERQIQRWLFNGLRGPCEIVVPNYTPVGWFECDLFVVTKAGLFHEYEVKLTASDFRADAKKRKGAWEIDGWKRFGDPANLVKHCKHDLLTAGHPNGPSRFWYVAPEGVISESELPSWAGLKVVSGRYGHFQIVRRAPRLHAVEAKREIVEHARGVCYWRFWNERATVDDLREKLAKRS